MIGVFIPEVTVEMIRNASLESIEELLNEGVMKDIEYNEWIPVSERLPEVGQSVLLSVGMNLYTAEGELRYDGKWIQYRFEAILPDAYVDAWMPLPEPYKGDEE